MVHNILTIWDATCTATATLLSLLLLAAATVLSTCVLVEDSAVGDEAAMLMAALLVSLLSLSTPVVVFEVSQTTSAVPLEEVAPLPVLLLMVGLAVLPPVALEGAVLSTVLFPLIVLSLMVGLMATPAVALEGVALLSSVRPRGTFLFQSAGLLSITANGAATFRAAFASHGGSIVCCWIWCRMVKVAQKGKDSGSWTLSKRVVPKFLIVGIRTSAQSSWELAFSLDLWIFLT